MASVSSEARHVLVVSETNDGGKLIDLLREMYPKLDFSSVPMELKLDDVNPAAILYLCTALQLEFGLAQSQKEGLMIVVWFFLEGSPEANERLTKHLKGCQGEEVLLIVVAEGNAFNATKDVEKVWKSLNIPGTNLIVCTGQNRRSMAEVITRRIMERSRARPLPVAEAKTSWVDVLKRKLFKKPAPMSLVVGPVTVTPRGAASPTALAGVGTAGSASPRPWADVVRNPVSPRPTAHLKIPENEHRGRGGSMPDTATVAKPSAGNHLAVGPSASGAASPKAPATHGHSKSAGVPHGETEVSRLLDLETYSTLYGIDRSEAEAEQGAYESDAEQETDDAVNQIVKQHVQAEGVAGAINKIVSEPRRLTLLEPPQEEGASPAARTITASSEQPGEEGRRASMLASKRERSPSFLPDAPTPQTPSEQASCSPLSRYNQAEYKIGDVQLHAPDGGRALSPSSSHGLLDSPRSMSQSRNSQASSAEDVGCLRHKPVQSWTFKDMCVWANETHGPRVAALLRDKNLTGHGLLSIRDEHLKQWGIAEEPVRAGILASIQEANCAHRQLHGEVKERRFCFNAADPKGCLAMTESQKLGEGVSGDVFCERWSGVDVAIKVLKRIKDEHQSFQREVEAYECIGNHPNVVPFLGVFSVASSQRNVHAPKHVLGFQLFERGSLDQLLQKKKQEQFILDFHPFLTSRAKFDTRDRVPFNKLMLKRLLIVTRVLHQASAGVLHLHNMGLLHRDISARNFLVSKQWVTAICDFGMCLELHGHEHILRDVNENIPVKWCAPETLRVGGHWSKKTDVWSFGVFMYELLMRKEPFSEQRWNTPPEGALEKIGKAIVLEDAKSFLRVSGACPTALVEIAYDCLKSNPRLRPTMLEVNERLHRYFSEILAVKESGGGLSKVYQPYMRTLVIDQWRI